MAEDQITLLLEAHSAMQGAWADHLEAYDAYERFQDTDPETITIESRDLAKRDLERELTATFARAIRAAAAYHDLKGDDKEADGGMPPCKRGIFADA